MSQAAVAGRWEMKEWTGANSVLIFDSDGMGQALDWRGVVAETG